MVDKQEERKREILMAALQTFSEKGYDKTSMDAIVKASGLSKGTLYWYFDNKQALFAAVIEMVFGQLFEEMQRTFEAQPTLSASQKLMMLAQQSAEFAMQDTWSNTLMTDFFLQAVTNEAAMNIMRQMYEEYITAISGIIQQGIQQGEFREVDPHPHAVAITAALDGIALQIILNPDWNIPEIIMTMMQTYLRGLQKGTQSNGNDD